MGKRLYSGCTLEVVKQYEGVNGFSVLGLPDRILELEKAIKNIEDLHSSYINLRNSPGEISEREQVLREWENRIQEIASEALRGDV